jgi:hypothetical protein
MMNTQGQQAPKDGLCGILSQKTRETTYVPGLEIDWEFLSSLSLFVRIRTNFDVAGDFDVIARVLMKGYNASAGTSFSRASASQAVHVQSSTDIGRAGWDSIHGLKLEAWDLLSKGTSSMTTAIDEDEEELEEVSEGEEWWWDMRSWTISLVVRTSLTWESVTREGSGYRGAIGTGGKPGVGVWDSTN